MKGTEYVLTLALGLVGFVAPGALRADTEG